MKGNAAKDTDGAAGARGHGMASAVPDAPESSIVAGCELSRLRTRLHESTAREGPRRFRVRGFLGFGTKHHLVPAEAIADEAPGSVTLKVDQQSVESAPTLSEPRLAPSEQLQRAAHEHYGVAAVL